MVRRQLHGLQLIEEQAVLGPIDVEVEPEGEEVVVVHRDDVRIDEATVGVGPVARAIAVGTV